MTPLAAFALGCFSGPLFIVSGLFAIHLFSEHFSTSSHKQLRGDYFRSNGDDE